MPLRILMVEQEPWYLLHHRLALARSLVERGHEVRVATSPLKAEEARALDGIPAHRVPFRRGMTSPVSDLRSFLSLRSLYRSLDPDVLFHNGFRPVVLGSAASRSVPGAVVVNVVAGLGHGFSVDGLRARFIRRVLLTAYRRAFRRPRQAVVFENADDAETLARRGVLPDRRDVHVVPGGVDIDRFAPRRPPPANGIVTLISRMLRTKGVEDFVRAARILRDRGVPNRIVLVGDVDPENPASIDRGRLEAWDEEGAVEWWGFRDDVEDVLDRALVVCLPSYYREGLPRILLEAAAAGRPLVGTDVPGCREVVIDGRTGVVVPVRDPARLADAIGRLVEQPELAAELGRNGRRLVEERFSNDKVNAVYAALVGRYAEGPPKRRVPASTFR